MPQDGFHPEQVDDTLEILFGADGHCHYNRICTQDVLHLANDLEEVGAGAVHLVDVTHTGHVVLVSLTPYGLGLWLYAAYCAVGSDGTVEHTQRALHFGGEIHVSRSIDEVELVLLAAIVPVCGGSSRSYRYASLLLLLHPVHSGAALMNLTYLVGLARVEEDAFGGSRFAGINMGHDTEVTRQM